MKKLLTALTLSGTLLITACTASDSPTETKTTPPPPPPAPVPTLSVPEPEKEWGFEDRFSFSVEEGTLEDVKVYEADAVPEEPDLTVDPTSEPGATGTPDGKASTDTKTSVPTDVDTAAPGGEVENPDEPVSSEGTESPSASPTPSEPPLYESLEVTEDPSEGVAEDDLFSGEFSEDDSSWESEERDLTPDTEYQWVVSTVDGDGKTRLYSDTVKTRELKKGEKSSFRSNIGDEQEVGVAAPIIITFNTDVDEEYRDDVEKKLKVTTKDKEVEGSWGWLADDAEGSRLHYRTKEFWPADTEVKAELPLENVRLSDEKWGTQNMTLDFTIGRKQEVVADAKSKRMKVYRDGEEIMDFPASLGSPKSPSYNGMHVVMSKHRNYTLTSERWGYSTPTEYAVRIHNNGEFIHAAPWSVGSQGVSNVSHGCVNLSTPRAKEYYDTALYGDPVEVKNSSVDLSKNASDISDWVYSWEEWQELSAL